MQLSEVVKTSLLEIIIIFSSVLILYGIAEIVQGRYYMGEVDAETGNVSSVLDVVTNQTTSIFQLTYTVNHVLYKTVRNNTGDKKILSNQIIKCVYNLNDPNDIHLNPEIYERRRLFGYKLMIFGLLIASLIIFFL